MTSYYIAEMSLCAIIKITVNINQFFHLSQNVEYIQTMCLMASLLFITIIIITINLDYNSFLSTTETMRNQYSLIFVQTVLFNLISSSFCHKYWKNHIFEQLELLVILIIHYWIVHFSIIFLLTFLFNVEYVSWILVNAFAPLLEMFLLPIKLHHHAFSTMK